MLRASTRVEGDRIVPRYLGAEDEPWLRALLDEFQRFVGKRRTEFHERLREPLPTRAPKAKLRMAVAVLDRLCRERAPALVPPKVARAALFGRASASPGARLDVLNEVAASFGVTVAELESALFADLPGERRVAALPSDLSPARLATDANLALVTSLVRRAARVQVKIWGNTRAVVRHARLMGLLCTVSVTPPLSEPTVIAARDLNVAREEALPGVLLDVSGPFALFHHTEVYGRALASLLPRLAWCSEYQLTAACVLGRGAESTTLVVRSEDPIAAGRELRRHDSRLEQLFDRDFRRAAPDWDLIREPQPVAAGEVLIFPDFELVHRRDPARRWLLEIVGFWTEQYLSEKLARLRAAGIERLVLCIDQRRHCGEAEGLSHARVIRYKTRIDPRAVLAILGG